MNDHQMTARGANDPAPGLLAASAIALAERWVREAADADVDPAAQRLAGVLQDPNGLPFTIGFVDGVMRPESLSAAATSLRRVAPLVPGFLPWHQRQAVRIGGALAPVVPFVVVPIARHVLRSMVGHLVVDARPSRLAPALARIRTRGHGRTQSLRHRVCVALGTASGGTRRCRVRDAARHGAGPRRRGKPRRRRGTAVRARGAAR